MKRNHLFITSLIISIFLINCSGSKTNLKDGTYEGRSQSVYTNEPFVAISKLYIVDGNIDSVEFSIIDTLNSEIFDDKYEKHYVGNQEYINQCRNDWKGINTYPEIFLKKQNLESLDAITGATWSYNMFVSATRIALEQARKKI